MKKTWEWKLTNMKDDKIFTISHLKLIRAVIGRRIDQLIWVRNDVISSSWIHKYEAY